MEIYSNEYRKYLGVKPLKDNYKCEIYENGCIKILVYFDKDKIVDNIDEKIDDEIKTTKKIFKRKSKLNVNKEK